jgi:uncharacterized paraquat-inducible protein A
MQLVYKEKIKEYIQSLIPTEEVQLEAERRYSICAECHEFDYRDNIEICKLCGCRIMGKVFELESQCPLKKH